MIDELGLMLEPVGPAIPTDPSQNGLATLVPKRRAIECLSGGPAASAVDKGRGIRHVKTLHA